MVSNVAPIPVPPLTEPDLQLVKDCEVSVRVKPAIFSPLNARKDANENDQCRMSNDDGMTKFEFVLVPKRKGLNRRSIKIDNQAASTKCEFPRKARQLLLRQTTRFRWIAALISFYREEHLVRHLVPRRNHFSG